MRNFLPFIGLLAGIAVVVAPSVQSQSDSKKQATAAGGGEQKKPAGRPAADHSADEAAIRANVTAFVKAYNAHDAKAVAALFTPDGQIVDKEGDASEGRDAIQKVFAGLFADNPQKRIEVTVDSIRFIGSDPAVETGAKKE